MRKILIQFSRGPLLLLAIAVLWNAYRSQLHLFVYPAYIPLVTSSAVLLMVLTLYGILKKIHGPMAEGRVTLISLVFIAVLALVVTPQPLSDATAQTRGVQSSVLGMEASATDAVFRFALHAASMELMDWLRVLGSDANPARFAATAMTVTGMIVDESVDDREQYVTRYIISCCLADARPVGMKMFVGELLPLPVSGQWYNIEGELAFDELGTPFIQVHSATSIPSPADPYAYL